MIRPNPGNFEVEKPDIKRMIASMDKMTRAGADGVVFGCIRGDEIDQPALRALTSAADSLGLETTFHRAFDALIDPVLACNLLADAGIDRNLVKRHSMGATRISGVDGIPVLTEVLNTLEDRIELVVGGGIGQETIRLIVVEALADLGMMSLHAYSSVLTNGVTDEHKVRGTFWLRSPPKIKLEPHTERIACFRAGSQACLVVYRSRT